ncbi:MAG TPA: hypothetical protein VGJ59_19075 [Jatrophihabitantaceae bacterium]|jgi:hypothetical protein
MLIGQSSVIGVLYWQGTRLTGWQLLLPLFLAGIGGGFFLAPITNVVLAGIPAKDAGAASGARTTALTLALNLLRRLALLLVGRLPKIDLNGDVITPSSG